MQLAAQPPCSTGGNFSGLMMCPCLGTQAPSHWFLHNPLQCPSVLHAVMLPLQPTAVHGVMLTKHPLSFFSEQPGWAQQGSPSSGALHHKQLRHMLCWRGVAKAQSWVCIQTRKSACSDPSSIVRLGKGLFQEKQSIPALNLRKS